jgi:hypothetical protein
MLFPSCSRILILDLCFLFFEREVIVGINSLILPPLRIFLILGNNIKVARIISLHNSEALPPLCFLS